MVPVPHVAAGDDPLGQPLPPSGLHDWLDPGRIGFEASRLPVLRHLALGADDPLPSSDPWSLYFEAFGIEATPQEWNALARFHVENPRVAAVTASLAAAVAEAHRARETAFPQNEDNAASERTQGEDVPQNVEAALRRIVDRILDGGPSTVSATERDLLEQVDLDRLEAAAAKLLAHAIAAEKAFPLALAADEALSAVPRFDPDALRRSPAAYLAEVAGRDRETKAGGTEPLPRSWAELAALPPEEALERLAPHLDALIRSSHDLSLSPPAALALLRGEAPIENPARFVEDLFTPDLAPMETGFVAGYRSLRAELGPLDPEDLERAEAAAARLEPAEAQAIGTLFAAAARYLDVSAQSGQGLLEARARADAILARETPLTAADVAALQRSVKWTLEYRADHAEAVRTLVEAARRLASLPTSSTYASTAGEGYLLNDGAVVILDASATHVTPEDVPHPPVVLVDLGGSDVYRTRIAAAEAPTLSPGLPLDASSTRLSIAIDLGGNDAYEPPGGLSLGAAVGMPGAPAFALLLDAAGADRYSANEGLAWGSDGWGVLLDLEGDDEYLSTGPHLVAAHASAPTALAAGVLVDFAGDDRYTSGSDFARLSGNAPASIAAFVDLAGSDTYAANCVGPPSAPCFALPRAADADPAQGLALFIDAAGNNRYPRPGDPHPTPQPEFGVGRIAYASDASGTTRSYDGDGDRLPDAVESRPEASDALLADTDGDGFFDAFESLSGTDPHDREQAPLGLGALDPTGILTPHGRGLLVDVPGLVAVGWPGVSVYRGPYAFVLDLGLADADVYDGAVGYNGLAIDFGGDDDYRAPPDSPAFAASDRPGGFAALVDFGGNDRYEADREALGFSRAGGATAVFVDLEGNDRYVIAGGRSQAFALAGSAYFVDLAGNDVHEGASQGACSGSGTAAVAVFVDAEGEDIYLQNRTAMPDGLALGACEGDGGFAAFVDLAGVDRYLASVANGTRTIDYTRRYEARFAVAPFEPRRETNRGLMIDAPSPASDRDGDGDDDAAEAASGTDAHDANRAPVNAPGFVLDLPRLGLVVGSQDVTTHAADHDYAVSVDLGGNDRYEGRAGGSSPSWPTALALDLSGDDVYDYAGNATALSAYTAARWGAAEPSAETYAETHVAGAQGAGIFGIGILRDAAGKDTLSVDVSVNQTCAVAPCARVAGTSQGAGLLGVGVLSLTGSTREVSLRVHAESPSNAPGPLALSSGLGQGAAIAGIGLLHQSATTAATRYHATATMQAVRGDTATLAQGFAAWGAGVLLDDGGNDVLTADRLAQGAAISAAEPVELLNMTLSDGIPEHLRTPTASLAALLLRGSGDDTAHAMSESQAYASGVGATAWLIDETGNDRRELEPPPGRIALGQSAARAGGTAILLDVAGNDRTSSHSTGVSDRAQAFADGGIAILIDHAGHDVYEARNEAQGHIRPTSTGSATLALFVDRAGADAYVLLAEGQGSTTRVAPAVAGVGVAAFADLGGRDHYSHVAPNRTAPPGGPPRPPHGNDWRWTVGSPSGGQVGVGIDDDDGEQALTTILQSIAGTLGIRVDVEILDAKGANALGPIQGHVTLRARVTGLAAGEATIQKVEFFLDGIWLGDGAPRDDGFEWPWNTLDRDASLARRYPDGRHTVEAHVHLRPATGASTVETVPLVGNRTLDLDNPPEIRRPETAFNVSLAAGAAPLRLHVDRDYDRAGPCCALPPGFEPGPDTWNVTATPVSFARPVREAGVCGGPTCAALAIASGGNAAYLTWSVPRTPEIPVGYRLVRQDVGVVAEIDARAPTLWRDPSPPPNPAYRLDVLLPDTLGWVAYNGTAFSPPLTLTSAPGPAAGLRARGLHSAIALVWNETTPGTTYEVWRRRADEPTASLLAAEVSATSYVDTTALLDHRHTYEVVPKNRRGLVPAATVEAVASPGHEASILLQGTDASLVLVENVSLGGGQVHAVPWTLDPLAAMDGPYLVRTRVRDGAQRTAEVAGPLVHLDATDPETRVLLPESVGREYANDSRIRVPLRAYDNGTGLVETAVLGRVDNGPWTILKNLTCVCIPGSPVFEASFALTASHGDVVEIAAASLDAAGNAAVRSARPWSGSEARALDGAIDRARSGAVTRHTIDLRTPFGPGDDLDLHVAPETEVPIAATVFENGTGLASVIARIGPHRVALATIAADRWGGVFRAEGAGIHAILVEARDRAGNVGQMKLGVLRVDPDPPEIVDARAAFANGFPWGRAGEEAVLRVEATDAMTDEGDLVVHVAADPVSSAGRTRLVWDAEERAYLAAVPLDRLGPQDAAELVVEVADPAGHVATGRFPVRVSSERIAASTPRVISTGPDRAVVAWTSKTPARGAVEFGPEPRSDRKTALGPWGIEHEVELLDLKPDTEYYARVLTYSEAGLATVSEPFTLRTGPAYRVELTGSNGVPYASTGLAVTARVARFDGVPSEARLDLVITGPRGSPFVAATADMQEEAGLELDVSRLREGPYAARVTAEGPLGRGSSTPFGFTVDRTPPAIRAAPETAAAGHLVTIRVEERGAGIDVANVSWTFDGTACAVLQSGDNLSCIVPPLPRDGRVAMNLTVVDRAGNAATLSRSMEIDALPPLLKAVVMSAEGFPRLRPGSTALLKIHVDDLRPKSVVADTSPIQGPRELEILPSRIGQYVASLNLPQSLPEGRFGIHVIATDEAGRTTDVTVPADLDATPPRIVAADVVSRGHDRAVIALLADEPVRWVRPGPDGAFSSAFETTVAGLAPGAPFEIVVEVEDQAGIRAQTTLTGETLRDVDPPAAIPELIVEEAAPGLARLRWAEPYDNVGVERYVVVRHGPGAPVTRTTTRTETHEEVPLTGASHFGVHAVDASGNAGPETRAWLRSGGVVRLTDGAVTPALGGPGVYSFTVIVNEAEDADPVVEVEVDRARYPMRRVEPDCHERCLFEARVSVAAQTLAEGPHTYRFLATAGTDRAHAPRDGSYTGPIVIAGHDAPIVVFTPAVTPATEPGIAGLVGVIAAFALARKGSQRRRCP